MGLHTGKVKLGKALVEVHDGQARLQGTDTIAGSVATLDQYVVPFISSRIFISIIALSSSMFSHSSFLPLITLSPRLLIVHVNLPWSTLLSSCVANLTKFTSCSPARAILAATAVPARRLGLYPRKGSLSPGADADILLLCKKTLAVKATIKNGQIVYVDGTVFPPPRME